MEDREIVELYWDRDEQAITQTQIKYGGMLTGIAYGVLADRMDAEEAVNDTYLKTWGSIPTERPAYFAAYLAKIARRTAVSILRRRTAAKRGGVEYTASLDELAECATDGRDPADEAELRALGDSISRFLDKEDERRRRIFLLRYFSAASVREIAAQCGMTESNVKTTLSRMRKKLREHLLREGY